MYDIIKNVILNENFDLKWIILNIKKNCARGDITDDQEEELIVLAQRYAKPENSYAPLQNQIDDLYKKIQAINDDIAKLSDRVLSIEKGEPQELVEPEPPVEDEYPEYVQPTGAHDAYHRGDKITFTDGKKYECIAPEGVAVVWDPTTYPAYWQEVAADDQ